VNGEERIETARRIGAENAPQPEAEAHKQPREGFLPYAIERGFDLPSATQQRRVYGHFG
jgi:hypothetical protein